MRLFVLLMGVFLSLAACAQEENAASTAAPTYEEGKDYVKVDPPVRTTTPDKIEVTELFWYGCGHCYHFEPLLNAWEATLPEDVQLVKSPAMWRESMQTHARIFYTAKALDLLDQIHPRVFAAMHKEHQRLLEEDEIAALFAEFNVDKEKFKKTFDSFGVSSQLQQADSRARGYKIEGTPELVVDGRYRVSSRLAGNQQDMLKVAKFLVDKIRAEKK